jgi:hypothetical protein
VITYIPNSRGLFRDTLGQTNKNKPERNNIQTKTNQKETTYKQKQTRKKQQTNKNKPERNNKQTKTNQILVCFLFFFENGSCFPTFFSSMNPIQ